MKYINESISDILSITFVIIVIIIPWLFGIVLAKGAWSTIFSVIMPPYAWYLLVEKISMFLGLI